MPNAEAYLDAAWRAAPRFGLEPETITLLSHSENVVVEVGLGGGRRVAMRLHRPGYNTLTQLRSEVAWVESLRNFGIPVPTAIATEDGQHYVSVDIPVGASSGGAADAQADAHDVRAHQVGVVDWVAGEPLGGPIEADGARVVDHYGRIGQLAASIRAHHASWTAPPGFDRRAWDLDGFLGQDPLWGRFWELEALTTEQRQLFGKAREALRAELGALATSPDHFGLIHADLHLGNLMADGDDLTVIDFDDAGHGWFVYELAVALHPVLGEPWEADAKAALVTGYREVHPLGQDEEARIDTFLTMRSLMIVAWLDARRELPVHQFFPDLVTEAEQMATRYLG